MPQWQKCRWCKRAAQKSNQTPGMGQQGHFQGTMELSDRKGKRVSKRKGHSCTRKLSRPAFHRLDVQMAIKQRCSRTFISRKLLGQGVGGPQCHTEESTDFRAGAELGLNSSFPAPSSCDLGRRLRLSESFLTGKRDPNERSLQCRA